MNLQAPYSWITEWIKTTLSADEFARETSLIGNEVEQKHDPTRYLNNVVVGLVKTIKKHPEADKLTLAETEIGQNKTVQIVCGGTNLKEGQIVAVAIPGATVSWHGDEEVKLEETKIRGEKSFGMICAAEEIGFEKLAKEGEIWDLTTLIPETTTGTPLAVALDLENETIFELEVTTNRPDTMAMIGQAREAYGKNLGEMTDPMLKTPEIQEGTEEKLEVNLETPDLCSRYMGITLSVEVKPSPWWLQKRLILAGAKPINNVVDITNYVRLEFGQPLHTFDQEKIEGGKIIVRRAKNKEKFEALDGSQHELTEEMLVIADKNSPVALAGIMGGINSGVTDSTTKIILEAANFNPISIRKTWRALNLQSDSQTIYEKGISDQLAKLAMARAIELLEDTANAKILSNLEDKRPEDYKEEQFTLNTKEVSSLIGIKIKEEEQVGILERLGFKLEKTKDNEYKAIVPFWRDKDIEAPVDLTEEIARIYGYTSIPSTIPTGQIPKRQIDESLVMENEIKDNLVEQGCSEIYSYSFVDPEDIERTGENPDNWLKIKNPIAEDKSVMRASLLPSMLRTIADNESHSTIQRLFELQRVYIPQEADLPEEREMLIVSITSQKSAENLFREIKGVLELLSKKFNFKFQLNRENIQKAFHPGRAATITVEGKTVGTIGELHPKIQTNFGIEKTVALLEIKIPEILENLSLIPTYKKFSTQPASNRDIAITIPEEKQYIEIEKTIKNASNIIRKVELFDIYRGEQVEQSKKSLAFKLEFIHNDKTLTTEEIDTEMKNIIIALKKEHNATLRD